MRSTWLMPARSGRELDPAGVCPELVSSSTRAQSGFFVLPPSSLRFALAWALPFPFPFSFPFPFPFAFDLSCISFEHSSTSGAG
jgi:hypothetical protein